MIPMSKRLLVLLMLLILAAVHTVEAQQATKIPRIGYLATRNIPTSTTPDPAADAFQQGLRELGYVQGKNILVEYRYAGGTSEDRIQDLVAEIVQLKVDVLVSPVYVSDSCGQTGDENDPHCHGNYRRPG